MMRKLTAICLCCTLLFVSSAPALAASCDMPHHAASATMCDINGYAMPMAGNRHDIDEQDCFLECGCGCHHNVDSLPHQFSPHATSSEASACPSCLSAADMLWQLSLTPSLLHHDDPPPELS